MIFNYRWVLFGPLGVSQSYEKAKYRKKFEILAVKLISQRLCKRAINSGVCVMQDGTRPYDIRPSLGPLGTFEGVAK